MTLKVLVEAVLLGVLLLPAAWMDWKRQRIPNALTLPFVVLGIAASALQGGMRTALLSAAAAAIGLLLGFVLYALGIAGGGDGKLIAAVGSIGGLGYLGEALLWTALFGLAVSILVLAWKRALIPLLRRLARAGWDLFFWNVTPSEPIVEGEGHKMPFGLVIAAGSAAAFVARLAGVSLIG